jgi:hypothetical protein
LKIKDIILPQTQRTQRKKISFIQLRRNPYAMVFE